MSRRTMRPWLGIAIAAIVAVVVLFIVRPGFRSPDRSELRDSLRALRSAADSCLMDVEAATGRMQAYSGRLDSMRARVRGLEDRDAGGVPADSYATYLDAVELYNDSVEVWSAREDTLRARDARCRGIVERHNALADSIRRVLLEET